MYVGGTYTRLVYSWYQNIFHVIAVLIEFHAANEKSQMKTILKQDSTSKQRQYIVPVSNLKARKIKTLLSLPIHLAHHRFAAASVAPLLLNCCSAVALLSLCFHSAVAAVAPAVATPSLLLSLRTNTTAQNSWIQQQLTLELWLLERHYQIPDPIWNL